MKFINLKAKMAKFESSEALFWNGQFYTYADLLRKVDNYEREISSLGVVNTTVFSVEGNFSPNTIACLIALGSLGHVSVPLLSREESVQNGFRNSAQVEFVFSFNDEDKHVLSKTGKSSDHVLLTALYTSNQPGLILFTSGSTGTPKALLHNLNKLTKKYEAQGKSLRTVGLLLFDHIGGLDTLFYNLFNGSLLAIPSTTRPDVVCKLIQDSKAEVLPASPSFLNLMLLSGAHKSFDLSTLKIMTFGSEVMPTTLLERIKTEFPSVKFIQKYGLSELGTLQTKSQAQDVTKIKIERDGVQARVVDDMLELKADFSFLGYLNSDENPFTADGWYKTGDLVEVEGEYYKIKGRKKSMVNVGGEKVNPAEVEEVIQQLSEVVAVIVQGEANAFLGNILVAKIQLNDGVARVEFEKKLMAHCRSVLPRYKVPQKIIYSKESLVGDRMKKIA